MHFTEEQLASLDKVVREIPRRPSSDVAAKPDLPQRPEPRNMGEHDPEQPLPYQQVGGANPVPERTGRIAPTERGNLGPATDWEFARLGGANPGGPGGRRR
jgi:hypothetical protein